MEKWANVANMALGERPSGPVQWSTAVDEVLASQAESDELSNELGGSVSENEPDGNPQSPMLWTTRLKKVAQDVGRSPPLHLSHMPPVTVVSSCTGSCAEGAVLKDWDWDRVSDIGSCVAMAAMAEQSSLIL